MFNSPEREHTYHAEAHALSGELTRPLVQLIPPQASLHHKSILPNYLAEFSNDYRVERILSYKSAYTHVSGNVDTKPGHGWATLATSVVEGLNIQEILTADRVVAQVATEHPRIGHIPSVTFLGTRFENLRIAGHPIHIDLDLNICGNPPADDLPYTSDPAFLTRVENQYRRLKNYDNLPEQAAQRYSQVLAGTKNPEFLECSLVNQVDGSFPGHSFGHVIHVPHFGTIYLGVLRLKQEDFHEQTPHNTTFELTMIEVKLGCIATGSISAATTRTNGTSKP